MLLNSFRSSQPAAQARRRAARGETRGWQDVYAPKRAKSESSFAPAMTHTQKVNDIMSRYTGSFSRFFFAFL